VARSSVWVYSVVDCQIPATACAGHPLAGLLPPGWAVARCGDPVPTIGGVDDDAPLSPADAVCVACLALADPGRPLVEQPLPCTTVAGDRPAPPADLVRQRDVRELAGLLALVVQLARGPREFPGRWNQLAADAMQHPNVRTALAATQQELER